MTSRTAMTDIQQQQQPPHQLLQLHAEQ